MHRKFPLKIKNGLPIATSILALLILLSACQTQASAAQSVLDENQIKGKQLFTQNCAACHATTPDTIIVGPSLDGVATRGGTRIPGLDARSYIEQSIMDPDYFTVDGFQDLMPKTFAKTFTGEELDSIVAYLMTLE